VEDYTNKYKGEQVEVALFGGEYQEGVLTAYCYVEDVAHIELNGHILVPLQNIASLHCSSRCDAPGARAVAAVEVHHGKIVLWHQLPTSSPQPAPAI